MLGVQLELWMSFWRSRRGWSHMFSPLCWVYLPYVGSFRLISELVLCCILGPVLPFRVGGARCSALLRRSVVSPSL